MARIIVIEDDEMLGQLLVDSLSAGGHSVELFPNAHLGIEAYAENPADIVVTDIIIKENGRVVPDGGITAAFQIKMMARKMYRPVKVIAITGAHTAPGMEYILTTVESVGADAVLAKPFPPLALLDIVDNLTQARD